MITGNNEISWRFLTELCCQKVYDYLSEIALKIGNSRYFNNIQSSDDIISTLCILCGTKERDYCHIIKTSIKLLFGKNYIDDTLDSPNKLESRYLDLVGRQIIIDQRRTRQGYIPTIPIQDNLYPYDLWYSVCMSYGIEWKQWLSIPFLSANFGKNVGTSFLSNMILACKMYLFPIKHRKMMLRIILLFIIVLKTEYDILCKDPIKYLLLTQWRISECRNESLIFRKQPLFSISYNDIDSRIIADPDLIGDIVISLFASSYNQRILPPGNYELLIRRIKPTTSLMLPYTKQVLLRSVNVIEWCYKIIAQITDETVVRYSETEEYFENTYFQKEAKECGCKSSYSRLLISYCFPYTKVHASDIYISSSSKDPDYLKKSLLDRVFISLFGGDCRAQYLSWEELPCKKFSIIQLDSKASDFSDQKIINKYCGFLDNDGRFLEIDSDYERHAEDAVAEQFKLYRHGMKGPRQKIPAIIKSLSRMFQSDDIAQQKLARLESLYTYQESYLKIQGKSLLHDEERDICELPKEIDNYIISYRETYNILDVSRDFSGLGGDNGTIEADKTELWVMFDTIIENASRHGFYNYEEIDKKMHITLTSETVLNAETKQIGTYIRISFCNNGRPLSISLDAFKTKNAFSGPTGHTGIGGYHINRMAVRQGGFINFPDMNDERYREWNTIIDIYLKTNEQ